MKIMKLWALCAATLALTTACNSDDGDDNGTDIVVYNDFHIAFANGTESSSATLVQGVADLTAGAISPTIGHELESSRTARIFASADGSTIWSLNYTVGTIEKLSYTGADGYTRVGRFDASVPLGATAVRFTKLNDAVGSVHYIKGVPQFENSEDPTTYTGHTTVASIGLLDLDAMNFSALGYKDVIDVTIDDDLARQGYFVSRIDSPVISGDKIYFGAVWSKYNPLTGKSASVTQTSTLVLDYPGLTNARVVTTDNFAGATNGYRTPTQHIDESGAILQLVSGNDEVHIAKLSGGAYTSYDFNLTAALGKPTASNGFFYAGGGIAYIPYEDLSEEQVQIGVDPQGVASYSSMWKLARVDLNSRTAVDLNVPDDLWLQQYQNSVVRDGKFYIALSPVGVDGNIYIFDVASTSPNAKLGATISGTGADQYFIGIY